MLTSLRILLGALAATSIIITANAAAAQTPAWAVGTWRGSLESYRNDPGGPDRVMVVEPSGQCRWDYARKAENAGLAKSCSFGADSIEMLTGGFSKVTFKHSGGKLRGTFTPSAGGKPFSINMSK